MDIVLTGWLPLLSGIWMLIAMSMWTAHTFFYTITLKVIPVLLAILCFYQAGIGLGVLAPVTFAAG